MADSTSKHRAKGMHTAEVFEEEIQDLERTGLTNWSSWLAGIGAFALLAGIVLMVMAYEARTRRGPTVVGNLPVIELVEPAGRIDHLPASFRWEPVAGVQSYLLTVQRADNDDVVLLRSSRAPSLSPSAEDLSLFRPADYRFTVEARGPDGKTRAWGEGAFSVAARTE